MKNQLTSVEQEEPRQRIDKVSSSFSRLEVFFYVQRRFHLKQNYGNVITAALGKVFIWVLAIIEISFWLQLKVR